MDKSKMHIIINCRKKLNSTTGATLMIALLFFIMCAVVGSVILAAAASSAGRVGNADTDANRQRYALMSAARFIEKELPGAVDGETLTPGVAGTGSIDFNQEWMTRSLQVDYVSSLAGNSGTDAANPIGQDDIEAGDKCHSRGDYVLALDQLANETYGVSPSYNPAHSPDENDEAAGAENLSFTNKWSYPAVGITQVLNTSALNETTHELSIATKSFDSLAQMRAVMAEAIYRNFWTDISKYDGADTDSWGGNAPAGTDNWKAPSEYSVSVKHLMIDVDGDEDIYPVFADITMNQDFDMTFELYCGSRSDKKDGDGNPVTDTTLTIEKAEDSLMQVWVVSEADGVSVKYSNDVTQKDDDTLVPLQVKDEQEETFDGEIPGEDSETIESDPVYGDVKVSITYLYDPEKDVTTVTTIRTWQVKRTKHIELSKRSVEFKSKWKDCVVTTEDPEPQASEG